MDSMLHFFLVRTPIISVECPGPRVDWQCPMLKLARDSGLEWRYEKNDDGSRNILLDSFLPPCPPIICEKLQMACIKCNKNTKSR